VRREEAAMVDVRNPAIAAYASDLAMAQHLDELLAELRDRGVTSRPLNILHYALELMPLNSECPRQPRLALPRCLSAAS
jgi:hypothetical protein